MIKDLSEALRRLINSLSVRPLTTILAILLIYSSYIVFKSYDRLEELIVTPSEEAQRFKEQLDSAALVNTAIENHRVSLNASSVLVRQFHNGRHDLTGIPFTESTVTFYAGEYNYSVDEPLSSLNASLRSMWKRIDKPECLVTYSPNDISSKRYFTDFKLIREVQCPLTNLLNYPIGTISVGFSDSNTVSDEEAVEKTAAMAKRITGYLNNGGN